MGVGEEVAGGGLVYLSVDAAVRRTEADQTCSPGTRSCRICQATTLPICTDMSGLRRRRGFGSADVGESPMRHGEGVFRIMTLSDRPGFVVFVVDAGDEAHCMLGVTRLCHM